MAGTLLAEFKDQFHRDARIVHMNNAGQSPVSRPAFDELSRWSKLMFEEGAHGVANLHSFVERARADIASLLGAQANEISFYPGTSAAISQVAFGLNLQPGDEVIVLDQEYPSNFYPWAVACERSGARLVLAKAAADFSTPVSIFEKHVTPRTRAIGVSWVQFRTGARMDLAALSNFAHQRGIFVCADIIQGAGCMPFDFHKSGLDAACGGSHKWLAGYHGAAYLLLRESNLERVRPLAVGAGTFTGGESLPTLEHPMREGSIRFEPGGKGFLEILALGASARLFSSIGIEVIFREVQRLTRKLAAGLEAGGYRTLAPDGPEARGGILLVAPTPLAKYNSFDKIQARLAAERIGSIYRDPGIRLSPHAHNTDEEIERVVKALTS